MSILFPSIITRKLGGTGERRFARLLEACYLPHSGVKNAAINSKNGLHSGSNRSIGLSNNTPQASPVVRCRDAQTGGLIFFRGVL